MRFLKLKLSTPSSDDLNIELREGINIISVQDNDLFSIFSRIPVSGAGSGHTGAVHSLKNVSYEIDAMSETSGKMIYFVCTGGELSVKYAESFSESETLSSRINSASVPASLNFIASSVFHPVHFQKHADPVLDAEKIRNLLIDNEVFSLDFPFFITREDILTRKDRELTDLNRERQLLELKNMKKDKLLKEIYNAERSIHKLERRRESILHYKTTLDSITEKIESRNRLSSKINSLKKDLIDLRDLKEKINSVENILKDKFSHFAEKGNEQIPDLEQIQESFNAFRDINEKLDKFSQRKNFYSGLFLKGAISLSIFSLTALSFLLFSSTAAFIIGIASALAASASFVTALVYYFKIRKMQPRELIEQKKKMEISLFDLLKKNNFSMQNFKTGELYEVLFQYFEDFINYRDINLELMELKKRISSSAGLTEKENRLETLNAEIESMNLDICSITESLDLSIHPRPDEDNIRKAFHEIDELLVENGAGIDEKKILITKFEEEIETYDRTEESSMSTGIRLEEILRRIDRCRDEISHIKFLNDVFRRASETWSVSMLEELSNTALEKFLKLTDNSFIKDDIAETINNIIMHHGNIKNEHRGLKKYLSFAIKAAISEKSADSDLSPFFMIDPFTHDNEFADNMKKLLPELLPGRQVVVIIPGNDPDIKGNLITLLK